MLEKKTPDSNSQPLKVEDILVKAEEIRNARDRQSSVTNSDLGEAFKLVAVVDEESKRLPKKRDLFKPVKVFWNWTGFREKKLLDLVQILVVPVAIAATGIGFQKFTKDQDIDLADSKAKQETLTKYLDQMSDLLEKSLLKSKHDSPMFIIAQSKTVIALQSLDPKRQKLVIQFLESANLNTLDGGKGLLYKSKLSKAQLQKADLSGANLREVDLSGAELQEANLTGANLSGANLSDANFKRSDLRSSNLQGANLISTNLKKADLAGAKLQGANLIGANFHGARFMGVDFKNVLMLYTDLSEAIQLNQEQLEKSTSICGSILPEEIKINKTRDCTIMPQILMKRYPKTYKTLKEAEDFIGSDGDGLHAEDEDDNKIKEK